MRSNYLGKCILLFTMFILYLCLSGCTDPFGPPKGEDPPEEPLEPRDFSTIENVLYNFGLSWEFMDIDLYIQCLDDNYEFHFDPADVQYVGADYWTREEDIEYTEELFEAGIDFDYNLSGTFQELDENQALHPDEDWYLCKRYLSAHFIYDYEGDTRDVLVNGWINFYLREAGQNSFAIVRIEDLTGGS